MGGQGPVASDLPHEQEMDKEKQELLGGERECMGAVLKAYGRK